MIGLVVGFRGCGLVCLGLGCCLFGVVGGCSFGLLFDLVMICCGVL